MTTGANKLLFKSKNSGLSFRFLLEDNGKITKGAEVDG